MKKLRIFKLLPCVVLFVVIMASGQSCNTVQQWFGKSGNFDSKHVRADRKALREQAEDDELWSGDDEYDYMQENEEQDRDRW